MEWEWDSGDSVRAVRGILACSALKQSYRDILSGVEHSSDKNLTNQILFIYLQGSRELLLQRLSSRTGHFMPASLLDSQLSDLEEPSQSSVTVNIVHSVESVLDRVKGQVDRFVCS